MKVDKYKKRYGNVLQKSAKDQDKQTKEFHRLREIEKNANFTPLDVDKIMNDDNTFGNRLSDNVARFGGSWKFIIAFVVIMVGYMFLNVAHVGVPHWDSYPFILLNLCLSCISAIQAPIIMMSQNRSAKRDKIDTINDAKTNLRVDAKMNVLLAKLDHQKQRMDDLDNEVKITLDAILERLEEDDKGDD